MATTPMMQQYEDAKSLCGDALLLFRMGDFYELFHDDAKKAARVLGLTLTSRDKGENPIPMAGFPHHQLDSYLAKLISLGFRAAVCEQVEDARKATGLVKREITRVVTPGTLTDEALLDPRENNYLAAVCFSADANGQDSAEVGLAWTDLSTGRFLAAVFPADQLNDQIARIAPAEVLVDEDVNSQVDLSGSDTLRTSRPAWAFGFESATKMLTEHFQTATLEGFGFGPEDRLPLRAAGAVLDYLRETQRTGLDHIDRLLPYGTSNILEIDEATRRSLELCRTLRDGRREGSLLGVIDHTATPMGSRLLADLINNPLRDRDRIEARYDSVEELTAAPDCADTLRGQLRNVYDLERLLARVTTGRASPRDLNFVGRTLSQLPEMKETLQRCRSRLLTELEQQLDPCDDLRDRLTSALVDDCPLSAREGGFIRTGYNAELDRLRELAAGGKQWIAEYQANEVANSGIPSLKVGYNKVFGYYIEVTNAHRDKVPDTYIRKQTLKNAERYITPELKQYEEQVLAADEDARELEFDLFVDLRDALRDSAVRLRQIAAAMSQLDVLASFAELARQRGYCRPQLSDDPVLEIRGGRHPVLDVLEPAGSFVPNDTVADADAGLMLLITGPNMAGKSTYIRQVALISLMAQMGSFAPAEKAVIGLADRIFARVGASDELARGRSTFMVEMTETARILNTATRNSLVILDEIGRGTSTYDGVSLAWAIVEHTHDRIGCRTLFATHYHELTDLETTLDGVKNLNVAVKEWEDSVVFLHKIVEGAADKSYGIHVARLAGVPSEVNERAKQILAQLENEHVDTDGRPRIANRGNRRRGDLQLTLFGGSEHPLLDQIRQLDLNGLTPLQALELLAAWQKELS